MADRTFDQIFKTVIVALATAALSGIGYLTLVKPSVILTDIS